MAGFFFKPAAGRVLRMVPNSTCDPNGTPKQVGYQSEFHVLRNEQDIKPIAGEKVSLAVLVTRPENNRTMRNRRIKHPVWLRCEKALSNRRLQLSRPFSFILHAAVPVF